MAICKTCSKRIVKDEIACDGICGNIFHAACLKRDSGPSATGLSTCNDCSAIKPCHVLRLMKDIATSLSTDQSFIADKINTISANWAGLQLSAEDINGLNEKIDRLLHTTELLGHTSTSLSEKSHELTSKLSLMSASIDDLRSLFSACDIPASSNTVTGPVMPIIDDIRRNLGHVKGELGSWSAAVNKNSELIVSIASDVRVLASRGTDSSVSPPPADARGDTRLDTPPLTVSPPLTESLQAAHGSTTTAAAQDTLHVSPPGPRPPSRRLRRGRRRASPPPAECVSGRVHHTVLSRSVEDSTEGGVNSPDGGVSVTLRPAMQPRCVFISRIHPDTTEDEVVQHLSPRIGASPNVIACRRINPPRGASGRSFTASFKVFVPEDVFQATLSPEIWPTNSIVREFIPRGRPGSRTAPKNASTRSHFTTRT